LTRSRRRPSTIQRALVLACLLVALVFVGEGGHILLDYLVAETAHHLFHIIFPVVAGAVFFAFVARDVRQRGWPRFSWRLDVTLAGDGARAAAHVHRAGQLVSPDQRA